MKLWTSNRKIFWELFCFLPIIVFSFYWLIQSIGLPINDFGNYYFGTQILNSEFNIDIYSPCEFNYLIETLGYKNHFLNFAPLPPTTGLFYLPFTLFSYEIGRVFFLVLSMGILLFSIQSLLKHNGWNYIFLLVIPVLFFLPIKNGILFGQSYFLMLGLFLLVIVDYQKKQLKRVSIWLTILISLKLFPAILLLYFFLKKDFRIIFYSFIGVSIITLISILIHGISVWDTFLFEVMPRASKGELSIFYTNNYQSILMILKKLFVLNSLNTSLFIGSFTIVSSLLIYLGITLSWSKLSPVFQISFWLLISILITPYGSTYSLILLMPLLLFLLHSKKLNLFIKAIFLVLIGIIGNYDISLHKDDFLIFEYGRLIALILFLLIITITHRQNLRKPILLVFIISFFGWVSFNRFKNIKQPKPIINPMELVCKYSNNSSEYNVWNTKGMIKKEVGNNQLARISDENRGYKYYTLVEH